MTVSGETSLRFAIIGAGFWARYQLAGWRELAGVECVALCDRTRSKAEALAREFHVAAVYDDAEEMLERERLDFVDVITGVDAHSELVHAAARHRVSVICQKPMAPTLEAAEEMVSVCREAAVPLLIHENWRWQPAIRRLRDTLASGRIGRPFRARIELKSGFPVFSNQPALAGLEQFILSDLGSHLLDVARFLFGEADSLYCQIHRAHSGIKGEDVATVMMRMGGGMTVLCEMAYAGNHLERDRFPETFVFVEGDAGSAELAPDFWLRTTTASGTQAERCRPRRYVWADPDYEVVHASIVDCQANLLSALRGQAGAETSGDENLETARLVFAAYESAWHDRVVRWPAC